MRVISAQTGSDSLRRTKTLTERFQEITPSQADLSDAGFLALTCLAALYGFAATFDTAHFMLVGAFGLLLGIATAHLVAVARRHWLWVVALVVAEFFLLGAAIALRDQTIAGFIPTFEAFGSLFGLVIGGWKELITTMPPVPGTGAFLALPYLLGLVAGALGHWVARRSRRAATALITPLVLLVTVILLGTLEPVASLPQGLVLAVVGFGWLVVRTRRHRRLAGTGRTQRASQISGVALVAVAVGLASLLGGFLPGAEVTRFVLRSYVQPPVDAEDLASPLVGFRKYSSPGARQLWETELLKVAGAPANSLLRIAVLDSYTGHTWSASGGSSAADGFQRVGSKIPGETDGSLPISITFGAAYGSARELGGWIPSLGQNTGVSFSGANQKTHSGTFRYNLGTGQGLLTDGDRFREGDEVVLDSVPLPKAFDAAANPGAEALLAPSSYAFLSTIGQKWAGNANTPGRRVAEIANKLKTGRWSNGTRSGEATYLPGHGQGRLTSFVLGQQLVGSDEQYAATFALLCNQSGFPARAVFGAIVPADGVVRGKNISAWVEVETDQGWTAIPPAAFIPDRNRAPERIPETIAEEKQATNVPPPNSSRTSAGSPSLPDPDLMGTKASGGWLSEVLKRVLAVLVIIGPPLGLVGLVLGGVVVAKVVRRRWRRTRGNPAHQVAAAWEEVLDQCRDVGVVVNKDATRLEQSRIIDHPAVTAFAVTTNTATFSPDDPTPQVANGVWQQTKMIRKQLLGALKPMRRFRARITPRSLLPASLATLGRPGLPKLPFRRPRELAEPQRLASGRGSNG